MSKIIEEQYHPTNGYLTKKIEEDNPPINDS